MNPVVVVVVLAVVGLVGYRIARYHGIKGALFGATINETLGEVYGSNSGIIGTSLKVHTLQSATAADPAVGLEFVARSGISYRMTPLKLQRSEADKLVVLLQQALAHTAT